ncbi:hypothetical protein BGAL_0138g00090 [Botrytis galanthina]|uniref:Uncharacterized protein n=1 Tax=Botrytis galanthina TaxID=278940 RepID=A0A4S8R192_9HELO|nr:hypothetical protein BGAL_0138g00090 [Botrytis galanthina]
MYWLVHVSSYRYMQRKRICENNISTRSIKSIKYPENAEDAMCKYLSDLLPQLICVVRLKFRVHRRAA